MYKQFFKLTRNPFELTPDPAFLFPTHRHKEALAALYYGVRKHKGFVVLTGEVGTGKTLLVRCLLHLLKNSDVGYSYIFNSILGPLEFLQYIAAELGLAASGKNKGELIHLLGKHIIERHQRKLTTVLIVDEAHHLSTEVLEEVRLLTNLESAQDKLLQILLVGQPELDYKLDSFELRQLKQRISLRAELRPLNLEETKGYVIKRLQQAGANSHAQTLFPDETVAAVFRYSRGTPRLINTICENGLITAYAKKDRSVSAEAIEDAARDLRLAVVKPPPRTPGTLVSNGKDEVLDAVLTLLRLRQQLRDRSKSVGHLKSSLETLKHEPLV